MYIIISGLSAAIIGLILVGVILNRRTSPRWAVVGFIVCLILSTVIAYLLLLYDKVAP